MLGRVQADLYQVMSAYFRRPIFGRCPETILFLGDKAILSRLGHSVRFGKPCGFSNLERSQGFEQATL